MNDMRGWRRGYSHVGAASRAAHVAASLRDANASFGETRLPGRRPRRVRPTALHGFTLVELLVVIAIIGILVALLLPAIQAAREASRRSQCSNNLKQIALGVQNHASTYEQFPSAGFGHGWVGDPHYGSGRQQPGGWIYNTLPFIEEQALHDMGMGVGTSWNDPARKAIFAERASITVQTMICPSRRSGGPYINASGTYSAKNMNSVTRIARSDYAGNIGNGDDATFPSGPGSVEETLEPGYELKVQICCWNFGKQATGVMTYWSFNKLSSVTDGLSKTYCVGEKNLRINSYENGTSGGDDQTLLSGMDRDNLRWARGRNQAPTKTSEIPPVPDRYDDNSDPDSNFGSAHPGVFLMAFCDGSVQQINYDIDPIMHGRFANRKDGEVAELNTK